MNLLHRNANADPGIHALIAGVSAYTHLPAENDGAQRHLRLRKLQSTALSAFRVADWLVQRKDKLTYPLASCRLLVAPSPAELKAEPRLAQLTHGCTAENFRTAAWAWRQDAAAAPENIALFYFAGHGAQRVKGSDIMLMEDFGADDFLFGQAMETDVLVAGMRVTGQFPTMARTQLYFLDACRTYATVGLRYEHLNFARLWDTRDVDDVPRSLSIFHATSENGAAYAWKGRQTLYSIALLDCLNGFAAEAYEPSPNESHWQVTTHSLNRRLQQRLNDVGAAEKIVPQTTATFPGEDMVLHRLDGPPVVDATVAVEPDGAHQRAFLKVLDRDQQHVESIDAPITPHPHPLHVPAGLYTIAATIDPPTPPFVNRTRNFDIRPYAERHIVIPLT